MKLRITVVIEHEVKDLSHYNAKTIAEAAANLKQWVDDGSCDLFETVQFANGDAKCEIEGIE